MRHDECCLLFAKRDEDTRKRIAALYHYVNTLPLTKHQRSKLIRLAEEALTSAEDNGYHFAMYDAGFCDFMEAAVLQKDIRCRFSRKSGSPINRTHFVLHL